jgi:hypothetical protein
MFGGYGGWEVPFYVACTRFEGNVVEVEDLIFACDN